MPWEKEQRKRDKGRKEVGQSSLGSTVANLTCQYSGTSAAGVLDPICCPWGSLALDLAGSKPSSANPERVKSVVVGEGMLCCKRFFGQNLRKYITSWRRDGTILLVNICGWCPLGYSRSVMGSALPVRHCQSGNSEKENKREREDWARLSEPSCLCHLAERQNRYAIKSANTAKISRRFFYACKEDLTRKKKKKTDVTKEKSCNTVGLKA